LPLSKRHVVAKVGLFLQAIETQQAEHGSAGEIFLPMSRTDIGACVGISAEARFADRCGTSRGRAL